ncbi:MAG: hypothetical protein PHF20_07130, partial [Halothiobacillaceae bacterium]|nr:hypothetical protein [Halothiobacillaceae bacterium]
MVSESHDLPVESSAESVETIPPVLFAMSAPVEVEPTAFEPTEPESNAAEPVELNSDEAASHATEPNEAESSEVESNEEPANPPAEMEPAALVMSEDASVQPEAIEEVSLDTPEIEVEAAA